ncbi:MAG TPA: ComF family protein [Phycisphaerae bacterium]|nr:ComF family protein [Phycisphaerae bacterium]HPS52000.1 ComF family protein [Phycisphaerae bacterium]
MNQTSEIYRDEKSLLHVRRICAEILDMFVPNVCASCGAKPVGHSMLCEECRIKLLNCVTLPYCPFCGTSLGPHLTSKANSGCYDCPVPMPRFRRVYRIGPYAGVLKPIIRQIKYHSQWAMIEPLTRLLAEHIPNVSQTQFDLVAPVPMFWARRILRNGNHSWMMAKCLAGKLNLPASREIIRIRNTPQQAHFCRSRRMENVKDAFKIRNPQLMSGLKILLVDDVVTTGATADEAVRTLLDAGASEVHLAVFAKAGTPVPYEDRHPESKS